MTIVSTRLANGQQSTINQYNDLRADVLAHDHSSGEGGTVDHGDLTDGVISGTYLDHDHLNTHVQGTGEVVGGSDDPGGDQGVHGLPPAAYVAGSLANQLIVQVGTGTTDTATQIGATGYYDQYEDIAFPTAFDSAPTVFIITTETTSARIAVTNVVAASFRALIGFPFGDAATQQEPCDFMWIAVGVKA